MQNGPTQLQRRRSSLAAFRALLDTNLSAVSHLALQVIRNFNTT